MALTKDSREFVEYLISNKVEFLIVGALAVSWHGFPRYSGDIDFFVKPSRENARRIISALEQFGFGSLGIAVDDLSAENKIIQLGIEPNRIDLITSISGVSFEEAWQSRVPAEVDGIEVSVIGREALIRNKRAAGRSKDLIDVDELTRKFEK
ncbi:MAG TPA: nucleotidyl transferase AbiEii/AbiGii toxin family protein [Bryobacteraceae bacterium]|nr:nucleotidyl transferase AbiEii/AbiGii toxin family protein [Bryobacteraceae bacterium]